MHYEVDAVADRRARIDPQQLHALQRNETIMNDTGLTGDTIEEVRSRASELRRILNRGGPKVDAQQDLRIPGPFRDIPARLYRPSRSGAAALFVFFHGGGFRFGNELANDRQMRELVIKWGGAVLSADYVHVPEHTFPDPVNEAVAVIEWMTENAGDLGIDAKCIAIGGASAGASVAFGAVFELRNRLPELVKAVVSIYGVLDNNLHSGSMKTFGNGDFYLTSDYIARVYREYLAGVDDNDCRAFAVKGDLEGLPPVFIGAAQLDPLRDDSLLLARLLDTSGQPYSLKVYPGVVHGFFANTDEIEQARSCIMDIVAFLRETFTREVEQ